MNYCQTGSKESQRFVSHRCAEKPRDVSIRRYDQQPEWRLAFRDIDPESGIDFLRGAVAPITYCPFCGERLGDA